MTQNMSPYIVYDDDEIRVIWHPGKTDFVLITFGDLISPAEGNRFFADTPSIKAGIAAIGVMAKNGNWYPRENFLKAYPTISDLIQNYTTRITYGGSMGGYAAVKFSKLLNASHVISLCPQWSIDIAECQGTDPGWQSYFSSRMSGMGVRDVDTCGRVFLFVDPFNKLDMFHCEMISKACAESHQIKVPFVGHNVTSVFSGTDNLLQIISSCRSNDINKLTLLTKSIRKNHFIWKNSVINYGVQKFPDTGYRLLVDAVRHDRNFLRTNQNHIIGILDYLIRHGNTSTSLRFFEEFRNLINEPIEQLKACAFLSAITAREVVIETSHQTKLVYSLNKNICFHAKTRNASLNPYVRMELRGQFAAFFVIIGETKFYLNKNPQGSLSISSLEDAKASPFAFQINKAIDDRFTVKDSDAYLCAEATGRLICDRKDANAWEHFSFGVD